MINNGRITIILIGVFCLFFLLIGCGGGGGGGGATGWDPKEVYDPQLSGSVAGKILVEGSTGNANIPGKKLDGLLATPL